MNTTYLYNREPISTKVFAALEKLLISIVSFYSFLLGTFLTITLYVMASLGIILAVMDLFGDTPDYLKSLLMIAIGTSIITSRVFRIFFWSFIGCCIPWTIMMTLMVLSIVHDTSFRFVHPIAIFAWISLLVLPPLVVSLFVTNKIKGKV